MNINYKEAQFDFFPNTVSTPDETRSPHFMAARFNLSIENLVIFSIVSIMVVVFTFSLGVERGKRLAARDLTNGALDVKASADASPVVNNTEDVTDASAAAPKVAVKEAEVAQLKKVDPRAKDAVTAQLKDNVKKPSGGYTVQIASYKSEKSAQKEVKVLLQKGYKAFVLPKGQHIVLCVGNFEKREDASVLGKKLKSNYQDYLVRRL